MRGWKEAKATVKPWPPLSCPQHHADRGPSWTELQAPAPGLSAERSGQEPLRWRDSAPDSLTLSLQSGVSAVTTPAQHSAAGRCCSPLPRHREEPRCRPGKQAQQKPFAPPSSLRAGGDGGLGSQVLGKEASPGVGKAALCAPWATPEAQGSLC